MTDVSLRDLLDEAREAIGDDATPAELTARVLKAAWDASSPDILEPAVLAWVTEAERRRVSQVEKQAFRGHEDNGAEEAGAARLNPAEQEMRALLAESCYVPGHGMVPWGALTRHMHELRVTYLTEQLERYATGVRATISRHERAMDVLAATGCPDLNAYADQFGCLPGTLAPQP